MIEHRTLPTTDLRVSPVALGTMSLCGNQTYDEISEAQAIDVVQAAIDAGINFIDTAPMYGDGEAERRVGLAIRGRRDRVVLATKVSSATMRRDETIAECEASLRRLGVDAIDLYQIHWNRRVVPIDETLDAIESLRRSGKARSVGVCNFGPLDFAAAVERHRIATDQVAYSLLFRAAEFELIEMCRGRGAGLLCYSPMAQGLLSGRYRGGDEVPEARARTRHFAGTRPQARHGERGCESETFTAVARLAAICDGLGRPMGEVALAWLLHRPGVLAVLAGASTRRQVLDNVRAAGLRLDEATLRRLDDATQPVKQALGPNLDPWQSASRIR